MKTRILAALLLLGAFAGYALAQTVIVPQVSTLNPNADAIQVIPNGAPQVGNKYAPPALLTNVYGYYKGGAVTTGFVYTFGQNVTYAQFAPSGTLAWGYFYLAAAPSDGARNCLFSTQTLTGATVYANTGQSINNAVTSVTANTGVCYLYSASNATWDRD